MLNTFTRDLCGRSDGFASPLLECAAPPAASSEETDAVRRVLGLDKEGCDWFAKAALGAYLSFPGMHYLAAPDFPEPGLLPADAWESRGFEFAPAGGKPVRLRYVPARWPATLDWRLSHADGTLTVSGGGESHQFRASGTGGVLQVAWDEPFDFVADVSSGADPFSGDLRIYPDGVPWELAVSALESEGATAVVLESAGLLAAWHATPWPFEKYAVAVVAVVLKQRKEVAA